MLLQAVQTTLSLSKLGNAAAGAWHLCRPTLLTSRIFSVVRVLVEQVRRRQPEWAPHPQQGADGTGSNGQAPQQPQQDPLEAADDFRPLQAADVQQSAAAIAGAAPQQEATSSRGSREGSDSQVAAGNGAAVLPGYSTAVVDGVPVTEASSSNGDGRGSTDNSVRALQPTDESGAVILEAGSVAAQQLAARVDVRVMLNVPPALRVVPGPLLGYAGESEYRSGRGCHANWEDHHTQLLDMQARH